jgi:hypothetical protein
MRLGPFSLARKASFLFNAVSLSIHEAFSQRMRGKASARLMLAQARLRAMGQA